MSFVEVACVAGAWKYLGSRKTRRARGLLGTRSLSSRVSPSRVPFFLALTSSKRLLPRLHTGYVEVVLSSNFMIFPIISALSLGRGIHTVAAAGRYSHTGFPQFEKLGLICEPFTSNGASYST